MAEGFNLIGLPNVRTAALPINESARSGFRVVDIIHPFEERRFGKEALFVYFVRDRAFAGRCGAVCWRSLSKCSQKAVVMLHQLKPLWNFRFGKRR